MRIAFLSPFYPYRGGIAQFSDSLFLALKEKNQIKAFTFKRQYPAFFFPGKTQFVSETDIDRNINAERTLDSINPFSWNSTAKKIIEFNPDLVLISYWMPFFATAFGKIAKILRRSNIKVIAILHNVIAHEKGIADKKLTKYFFNQCDGFVTLNENSKKDLLSLQPDSKSIISPHPLYDHYGEKIDTKEARKKLGISEDKKILLFFGFIRDYKGLDLLIEAMKILDDTYVLVIAGEVYGSFDKYKKLVGDNNLSDRIILHIRFIVENEIPLFFSAADVCVLPYRSATQSGIIGMAYHFEIPVIVTNTGGLAEMVEDGKTGVIVKEINAEDIAGGIKKFFSFDLYSVRENIRKLKSKYSWNAFAESIIDFTNSIYLS